MVRIAEQTVSLQGYEAAPYNTPLMCKIAQLELLLCKLGEENKTGIVGLNSGERKYLEDSSGGENMFVSSDFETQLQKMVSSDFETQFQKCQQ